LYADEDDDEDEDEDDDEDLAVTCARDCVSVFQGC
jgi:hypothetical protein